MLRNLCVMARTGTGPGIRGEGRRMRSINDLLSLIGAAVAALAGVGTALVQRWSRPAQTHGSVREGRFPVARRPGEFAGIVGALALASAAAVALVAFGIGELTPSPTGPGVPGTLWQLMGIGVAVGVLSFAMVEFVKRQSPLRPWFYEQATGLAFGPALILPPPAEVESARPLPGLLGRLPPPPPLYFNTSLQHLSAQLVQRL